MKKAVPLILLLFMSVFASAQTTTPNFTESTPQTCQVATTVCNGLPLDGGGKWQFILENNVFSITSGSFVVQGSPSTGTGGLQVTSNTVKKPPYGQAVGAKGEVDFDWTATDQATEQLYTGTAKVQAHWYRNGRWLYFQVDSAESYIQQ
jgi:hypothetical protein